MRRRRWPAADGGGGLPAGPVRRAVRARATASYVRFDLGMVHQIDYYTGVVFRGYVEGAGDAVLSGGR